MKKTFEKLFSCLGEKISKSICSEITDFKNINEIRIIVNQKPVVYIKNKAFKLKTDSVSIKEIQNIFASLCEFSVHAYKNVVLIGIIYRRLPFFVHTAPNVSNVRSAYSLICAAFLTG